MTEVHRRVRGLLPLLAAGALVIAAIGAVVVVAQQQPPPSRGEWSAGTLTETDLRALVDQMSFEERAGLVHGSIDPRCEPTGEVSGLLDASLAGIARLGIPELRMTDGPAGVRLDHEATALPSAAALTATFDRDLAEAFGRVLGSEARALGQDLVLSPMVNQVRFATAGRNFETLGGEDSFLAGQLGAAEVAGIHAEHAAATAKHFVANNFENDRETANVEVDPQTLADGELVAFQALVDSGVDAVMCSYNRVGGIHACSSEELLQSLLRDDLGFSGPVMSDWWAAHAPHDLIAGMDLEMPTGLQTDVGRIAAAMRDGTPEVPATADRPAEPARTADEWQDSVDQAAVRVLRVMNAIGLLEGTMYGTQFTGVPEPIVPERPQLAQVTSANTSTARRIAEQAATLLKNDDASLPIDLSQRSVLIVGPSAATPLLGGGGSSNVTPHADLVSPLDAIRAAAGADADVRFAAGYDLDGELIPAEALSTPDGSDRGLLRTSSLPGAAQDATGGVDGSVGTASEGAQRIDEVLDLSDPEDALPAGSSARWRGSILAPAGTWQLHVQALGQQQLQLFAGGAADPILHMEQWAVQDGLTVPSWHRMPQTQKTHREDGTPFEQRVHEFQSDGRTPLSIDLRVEAGSEPTRLRLTWTNSETKSRSIREATAAASTVDRVVVLAHQESTEGADRGGGAPSQGLTLDGYQDELIDAIASANPETTVVLNIGDAVLMPWWDKVDSVLSMWYSGEASGPATAAVLAGEVSPGGKSPVTFPLSVEQLPEWDPGCTDARPDGNCPKYPGVAQAGEPFRTLDYSAVGTLNGYRWYDRNGSNPRIPFGHGLSYTSFEYSDLVLTRTGSGVTVQFTITNDGDVPGSEAPQVYLAAGPETGEHSERTLAGFDRVDLRPGEHERIELQVSEGQLSALMDPTGTSAPSVHEVVQVGASSRDIRLASKLPPE